MLSERCKPIENELNITFVDVGDVSQQHDYGTLRQAARFEALSYVGSGANRRGYTLEIFGGWRHRRFRFEHGQLLKWDAILVTVRPIKAGAVPTTWPCGPMAGTALAFQSAGIPVGA
jgi:hypothetical protein